MDFYIPDPKDGWWKAASLQYRQSFTEKVTRKTEELSLFSLGISGWYNIQALIMYYLYNFLNAEGNT
jgi:hypothetical protein